MRPSTPTIGNMRGFTLIEVIMVTILIAIVGVLTSLYIVTGISGYVSAVEHADMAQRARLALARITAELSREMASVVDLAPATGENKTYIQYGYDITDNTKVRHIFLAASGARYEILLKAGATAPVAGDPEVLVDDVSAYAMVFKKADDTQWNKTDDLAELARIDISLTLYVNAFDTDTKTFTTSVTPPDFDDVVD